MFIHGENRPVISNTSSPFCKRESAYGLHQHQSKLPKASSEEAGQCHCKAVCSCLWKIMATGEGSWRARRKIRETMGWSTYLDTEEGRGMNSLGCNAQMYHGQVVIWSSQNSFTKGKSHLTNLIGFFNKIAWGVLGKQRVISILTLLGLSSLSQITPLLAN